MSYPLFAARFPRLLTAEFDLTPAFFLLADSSFVTAAVIFEASTLYRAAARMRLASFDRVSEGL